MTARCRAEGTDPGLIRFTRRQLREALSFGDTQLKVHLARLADYELIIPHRTGSAGFCYELAWQPAGEDGGTLPGPAAGAVPAATMPDRSGSGGLAVGPRPGPGRGVVGPWSARPRSTEWAGQRPREGIRERAAAGKH